MNKVKYKIKYLFDTIYLWWNPYSIYTCADDIYYILTVVSGGNMNDRCVYIAKRFSSFNEVLYLPFKYKSVSIKYSQGCYGTNY